MRGLFPWLIQFFTLYLPLANFVIIPPTAFTHPNLCTFLVLSAVLTVKSRVKSSYIHRIASNALTPHNSLINPFELIGDIRSINKEDYRRSIIMVAPHGPTFYPVVYLGALFEREFDIPYTGMTTPALFKIPYAPMLMTVLCNIVGVDPVSLTEFLKGDNGPGVTYPGGFDDVFDNSSDNTVLTVNVTPSSLLFRAAADYGRNLIPTLVINETEIYTHSKLVVDTFKYVHKNYTRTGIPVPPVSPCGLPLLGSTKKMLILYGKPVKGNDCEELALNYIDALKELHQNAVKQGITNKPMNVKIRGSAKL